MGAPDKMFAAGCERKVESLAGVKSDVDVLVVVIEQEGTFVFPVSNVCAVQTVLGKESTSDFDERCFGLVGSVDGGSRIVAFRYRR